MSLYLGIDTSNYTSSVGVYDSITNDCQNHKQLLAVADGQLGLRQSEAVFSHVKNLPAIIKDVFYKLDENVSAVGVSVKPRDVEGSYMPCFLVGELAASSIAYSNNIQLYRFSHQAGHIAAALYSSNRFDLFDKKLVAFHVSGGTTEAVMVTPDKDEVFRCEIIARSMDLKFGQAIDRLGNKMGLPFPSGKMIDELARKGELTHKVKVSLKDGNCNASGIENIFSKMLLENETYENVARFTIEYIMKTLEKMTEEIILKYGDLPLVFAGGVMSNSIISENFKKKFNANFATPEFSSDNACGAAVLAYLKKESVI
ncbi:MAG: peptidase M22 [Oscillospiraceae bacterium]